MTLDPLSFAALAASGPMLVRQPPATKTRRCSLCNRARAFSLHDPSICQVCEAPIKLSQAREHRAQYRSANHRL